MVLRKMRVSESRRTYLTLRYTKAVYLHDTFEDSSYNSAELLTFESPVLSNFG